MSEATVKPEYVKRAAKLIFPRYTEAEIDEEVVEFYEWPDQYDQLGEIARAFQSDAESHASELERVRKKLSFMEVSLEEIQRRAKYGVDNPDATWPCEAIVGLCEEGLSLLNTPETTA